MRNVFLRLALLLQLLFSVSTYAGPHDDRGVTLLVQGAGPIPDSKAAEAVWGRFDVSGDDELGWTGFVGYLVRERGWKIGGIFRSEAEQILPEHLDGLGAHKDGPADFYLLASSVPAQEDGMESRARELATAVQTLREMTGAKQVRCLCYSASGVAARIWMQGAITNPPYEEGTVSHLITFASPHFGVGGWIRPVTKIWDRFGPLAPGSRLLERINRELDLPQHTRYTAVVIQAAGMALTDTGQSYLPHVRFSQEQLDSAPPLLRVGHDGAVHTLSAQLHLTPAAARYENQSDCAVEVMVCRPRQFRPRDVTDLTPHTLALQDKDVWETLYQVMSDAQDHEGRNDPDPSPAKQRAWATQIALHLTELQVKKKHAFSRISASELAELQSTEMGRGRSRFAWLCRCATHVPRPFRDPEMKSYEATGSFELVYDRFHRPLLLENSAFELRPK